MNNENKPSEQFQIKIAKLHQYAKDLEMSFDAVLAGDEHAIKAVIRYVDLEKYPEIEKTDEPKPEEKVEEVKESNKTETA